MDYCPETCYPIRIVRLYRSPVSWLITWLGRCFGLESDGKIDQKRLDFKWAGQ